MTNLRIRKRETGAVARLERHGGVCVESATGGRIDLVTTASKPGFNPVDLLYASLSACVALSARIAASELGLFEQFGAAEVTVSGSKADEEFSRIEAMQIRIRLSGELTPGEKDAIVHRAEQICTISNTLRRPPRIDLTLE